MLDSKEDVSEADWETKRTEIAGVLKQATRRARQDLIDG